MCGKCPHVFMVNGFPDCDGQCLKKAQKKATTDFEEVLQSAIGNAPMPDSGSVRRG
jgi:hypothetical protein